MTAGDVHNRWIAGGHRPPLQFLLTAFPGGVRTRDVAMDESSPQAMLVAATTGFSAGIEAGYRLALHVDDLGPPVDPQTTVRIVPNRIECRRVEWRLFDPVHGR